MSARGSVSERTVKGRTYYRIRISVSGRMHTITNHKGVKFSSQAHAESVLEQIRGRLADAPDPTAAIAEFLSKQSKPNLVSTLLLDYARDMEERAELGEISANTLRNVYRWIPREGARRRKPPKMAWWDGTSVHEIRTHTVEKFRRHLEREGLGVESVRSILESLRSFLIWCKRREIIDRVPEVKLPTRVRKRPKLLTPAQQKAVLAAIPWRVRGIYLLMCLGVRPGAARAVLVEDIVDGFVLIRSAVQGSNTDARVGTTKGKRENWVPITRELAKWINEFAAGRHPKARLFWNPSSPLAGQNWNHKALHNGWRDACTAAGVPYVSLYKGTKHSFATGRIMAGKSKDAVAEFMQIGRNQVDTYAQWARELSAEVLAEEDLSDETVATITALHGQRVDNS